MGICGGFIGDFVKNLLYFEDLLDFVEDLYCTFMKDLLVICEGFIGRFVQDFFGGFVQNLLGFVKD